MTPVLAHSITSACLLCCGEVGFWADPKRCPRMITCAVGLPVSVPAPQGGGAGINWTNTTRDERVVNGSASTGSGGLE